mmetsp:Transcript_757/g.1251  ORF Transcript_757/g.1251 Transcript_757/m.1251 type:complete len:98 (-) Transcript_757:136-429(-)
MRNVDEESVSVRFKLQGQRSCWQKPSLNPSRPKTNSSPTSSHPSPLKPLSRALLFSTTPAMPTRSHLHLLTALLISVDLNAASSSDHSLSESSDSST